MFTTPSQIPISTICVDWMLPSFQEISVLCGVGSLIWGPSGRNFDPTYCARTIVHRQRSVGTARTRFAPRLVQHGISVALQYCVCPYVADSAHPFMLNTTGSNHIWLGLVGPPCQTPEQTQHQDLALPVWRTLMKMYM